MLFFTHFSYINCLMSPRTSDYCILVIRGPSLCVTVKLLRFLLPVHSLQVLGHQKANLERTLHTLSILLRIECVTPVVQPEKKKKGAISKTLNRF